jgi:HNH endonuclease
MTIPSPFAYARQIHTRTHGPIGYADYTYFKPWIRDEFTFRCVYCLERELWYPSGHASFVADHVEPKKLFPGRLCDYNNLVYCCNRCNSARWLETLLNPCAVALGDHLVVSANGSIKGLTSEGKNTIDLLHLDSKSSIETRRFYLDLVSLKVESPNDPRVHKMFIHSFGYPADLPNLSRLKPPGGNPLEQNTCLCYEHLRRNGNLDEVY